MKIYPDSAQGFLFQHYAEFAAAQVQATGVPVDLHVDAGPGPVPRT